MANTGFGGVEEPDDNGNMFIFVEVEFAKNNGEIATVKLIGKKALEGNAATVLSEEEDQTLGV